MFQIEISLNDVLLLIRSVAISSCSQSSHNYHSFKWKSQQITLCHVNPRAMSALGLRILLIPYGLVISMSATLRCLTFPIQIKILLALGPAGPCAKERWGSVGNLWELGSTLCGPCAREHWGSVENLWELGSTLYGPCARERQGSVENL
jgi:hypothetical protein